MSTTPQADPPPAKQFRSTGVFWAIALLLVAIALLITLFAQNNESVDFDFLWLDGSPSMAFVIAISALAGAAVTEGLAGLWRHRRRVAYREHAELEALRAGRIG